MPLLLLFIAIPLIEIALFIQVGGAIGLGWTLAIVLGTAVLGSWMVRRQGAMALDSLRRSFSALNDPTEPLAHGAMILFSGALLLTPGFFTDALGFALLLPPVRAWVFRKLSQRVKVQSFTMGQQTDTRYADPFREERGDVIDGEFEEVTPDKRPTHQPPRGPSGWTKH
ncbi:FxsA family protein [Sinisalibacter aestuarii]|uniref:Exclusion protein FxsA n=1 Tax=Sinisalibacter aestuarii TaxID=2949426 RepID=A0ABQ5LNU5_9RHOB|nr:FxsA family protein [Sinisalibacter aestuarii]GKY86443.1 exclusion protein FxsA [Sinisalibacter aestuarii]